MTLILWGLVLWVVMGFGIILYQMIVARMWLASHWDEIETACRAVGLEAHQFPPAVDQYTRSQEGVTYYDITARYMGEPRPSTRRVNARRMRVALQQLAQGTQWWSVDLYLTRHARRTRPRRREQPFTIAGPVR